MAISVRRAVAADLEGILEEARALNTESAWGWTWNNDAAREYLASYIAGGNSDILLLDRDGGIAGGALVSVEQECWDERLAVIDKFFVVRRHRRGTASARLAQATIDWGRARGAAHLPEDSTTRSRGIPPLHYEKGGRIRVCWSLEPHCV